MHQTGEARIRGTTALGWTLAWLGALALLPAEAAPKRRQARTSAAQARQSLTDALAPPEDPVGGVGIAPFPTPAEAPAEFSLDLLAPFFGNSDPEQASRGTPSPEATPEARLGWTRRLAGAPLRLSAVLDATSDRYAAVSAAGSDLFYGRLRAQRESGQDDQEWQPFASYGPTLTFTPGLTRRLDRWHDVGFGIARSLSFDGGWRRLPAAADTEGAPWMLGFNAALQRRWQLPGPDSLALLVNPSLTRTLSAQWSLSFEADITRRWYDRAEGRRRRDWLATPVLTVEFTPPEAWLPAGAWRGHPVVDLQLYFTRQDSNHPDARFRQYGGGPILRTGWSF